MSTHISAERGAIAETILLPGDPLRAQYIAETFFDQAVRFNTVRNMYGFTGSYGGRPVSVMGTGMGMPSLSIYVNELLSEYGVKRLVRVGTCGGLTDKVHVRDVILALAASSNSGINLRRFQGMSYAPAPSFELLRRAHEAALTKKIPVHVGPIVSSDTFYSPDPDEWKLWARYGVLAVEMETAELYTLAAQYGAEALSVLTVSDHLVSHEETSADERERSFAAMIELALEAALSE